MEWLEITKLRSWHLWDFPGNSTSWEIDGETVETVADFIFGGSKITVDGDCSHEIKRCLLLGRKALTNLDSILKSRDIMERVGRFGRMAMKHVKYHVGNELPVQVRCMMLDAWGWCTGTAQRDGMGREEGGRFRRGSTCIPVMDSFWCLAKLIQLCKV